MTDTSRGEDFNEDRIIWDRRTDSGSIKPVDIGLN